MEGEGLWITGMRSRLLEQTPPTTHSIFPIGTSHPTAQGASGHGTGLASPSALSADVNRSMLCRSLLRLTLSHQGSQLSNEA